MSLNPNPQTPNPPNQAPDKNSNLRKALEYLVMRRLANNTEEIEALRLTLVEGMSPSEVGRRLNVPKALVKTTAYMFEKIVGDHRKAAEVLKTFLPAVMQIQPVIKTYYGREYVCTVCGLRGVANASLRRAKLMHIKQAHKDLVNKYVDGLIAGVRT